MRVKTKLSALIVLSVFGWGCCKNLHAQTLIKEKKNDSLKTAFLTAPEDTDKVLILLELSKTAAITNCDEKLQYARQAQALAEKLRWSKGICRSLAKTGDTYAYCLKNYLAAIKTYQRVEQLARQNNYTKYLSESYTELAKLYKLTGHYASSINYYNKTIELTTDKSVVIGTLGNIGLIYTELGDFTKALDAYERSLRILTDTISADKHIPATYLQMEAGLELTMADIYLVTGGYDKALYNYQEALAVDNDVIKCMAYNGIGNTYFLKHDPDKSIFYFEKLLNTDMQLATPMYREIALNALAKAWFEKKDIDKATAYALQSRVVAVKNNNEPQLAETYTTLGEIGNYKKQYTSAVNYLQQAIAIAQRTGAKDDEKSAWEVLSRSYTGMNNPAKAFEAYKNFIALRDSVYNADKAKELTRLDMQGEFDRKQAADSVREADEKKIAVFKLQRQRIMSYSGFAGVAVLLLLAFLIYRNYSSAKKANVIITKANETIKEEKQVSEKLLLNILPAHVAEELKAKGYVEARQFDNVTVLFTDFVSFTTVAERLTAPALVAELHTCFKAFDNIIGKYGIEKIKTVGDAYLAVAGLPSLNDNHAADIINAAIEIRDFMKARKAALGDDSFGIRIGVNSGSVVAGIVGVKKFAYDIWGDTVNTAARMEQNSEPGKINISQATYEIVKDKFACNYRGEIAAKNKGTMKMYFVEEYGG